MYWLRYYKITFFFAKVILSFAFWDLFLSMIGLKAFSLKTRSDRMVKSASDFRNLAVNMGGVMIKVGQFLSSRVDVLPMEIVEELSGLQDEVPSVYFEEIRPLIEAELGASLSDCFLFFNPAPLAAASLGQVHQARIDSLGGNPGSYDEVVVKIQRPHIEQIIKTDLAAISKAGSWLYRYRPIRKRVNVPALIEEFSRVLYEEIDYIAEGQNAEKFAELFKDNPGIKIPGVYWELTTKKILTLEDVYGIKITDYEAIENASISRKKVAIMLLDTYLQQIFEDGFFHADPHPGNLFVSPSKQNDPVEAGWTITFVDFGMVGILSEDVKSGLRDLLVGIGIKDSKRVINAYQKLGILLETADLDQLEQAGNQIFDQFWGKNMQEIQNIPPSDFIGFLDDYRELLYSLPFQLPNNLLFLGRAIGILSGICTGLDPEFNAWNQVVPYVQKMIESESEPFKNIILDVAKEYFQLIIQSPKRIDRLLTRFEAGKVEVKVGNLSGPVQLYRRSVIALVGSIMFMAFFLGGILLYVSGIRAVSIISFSLAMVWILVSSYSLIRMYIGKYS